MAVIITAEVAGQTREGYDGMLSALAEPMRQTPGFLFHGAYQGDDGSWRVVEVWETREQANGFFAKHIAPNLPPGVRPKRRAYALVGCVQP